MMRVFHVSMSDLPAQSQRVPTLPVCADLLRGLSARGDAPRGRAAKVKVLEPPVFRTLARQTEILAGDGASRAKGKWQVLAATAASEEAALELYDQIREAGFAARIRPNATEAEGWNYELLLGGFSSADEAGVAAARLKAATGLKPGVVR